MAFTYDLSTNVGKVRLKIRDTDSTKKLFSDAELQFFVDDNDVDLDLAAADALEALVANAALLHKLEELGEYKIDSKGMAAALMKAAERYRARSEEAPAIDSAERNLSDFTAGQIIWNDLLRKG